MAKKRTVHAGQKKVAQLDQYTRNQEMYFAKQKRELERSIDDWKLKCRHLKGEVRLWRLCFWIVFSFLVGIALFG